MLKYTSFILLLCVTTSNFSMEKKIKRSLRDLTNWASDTVEDAGEFLNEGEKIFDQTAQAIFGDNNSSSSRSSSSSSLSQRPTTQSTRRYPIRGSSTSSGSYSSSYQPSSSNLDEIIAKSEDLSASSKEYLWKSKRESNFNFPTFSTMRSLFGLFGSGFTLYIGINSLLNNKHENKKFGYSATMLGIAGCCSMGYNLYKDYYSY